MNPFANDTGMNTVDFLNNVDDNVNNVNDINNVNVNPNVNNQFVNDTNDDNGYYNRFLSQSKKPITLATIQMHQQMTRQKNGIFHELNRPSLSGDEAIEHSQLSTFIKSLINRLFTIDNDLDRSFIEEPSIRLLEEVTEEEQKEAIYEFVDRYKKAKHKIKKSKPGYFRGVCQKYWKQNREKKKVELLAQAEQNVHV